MFLFITELFRVKDPFSNGDCELLPAGSLHF